MSGRGLRVTATVTLLVLLVTLWPARPRTQASAATNSSPYSSVSHASVHLSSVVAGATNVTWSVGLRTSGEGALAASDGSVSVVAPPGTVLPSNAMMSLGGSHRAPVSASVTVGIGGSLASIAMPEAVTAGATVQLTFSGVTNPPTSGAGRVLVSTSSDLAPASSSVSFTGAGHALGGVKDVSLRTTSDASGADQVNWNVSFIVPGHGGLSGNSNEIYLMAPPGTKFAANAGFTDTTSGATGGAAGVDGSMGVADGGSVAWMQVPFTVRGGDHMEVSQLVDNNPAPLLGQLFVATSSDPRWVAASVRVVPDHAVSDVSVTSSSPTAGAAQTNLTVTFRTSPSGGLVAGQSEVTLVGPPGTEFAATGNMTDLTTGQSHGFNGVYGGVGVEDGGAAVSSQATVTVRGGDRVSFQVTTLNPASGRQLFTIQTSSDPIPVTVPLLIRPASAVTDPSVKVSGSTYSVTWRTSAYGALLASQGQVEILGPPGVKFNGGAASLSDSTNGASFGPGLLTNNSAQNYGIDDRWLTFFTPFGIGAGNVVTLTVTASGAPTASSDSGVTIFTTSDTRPVVLPLRVSGGANATGVGNATAQCSTLAAGASGATCSVTFRAAHGLAAGTGTMSVASPVGFSMINIHNSLTDATTHQSAAISTDNLLGVGANSDSIELFTSPVSVHPGDLVTLVLEGVKLPPVPGPVPLTVTTSSDLAPVTVTLHTHAASALSLVHSSESSNAPGASGVTYTALFHVSGDGGLALQQGTVTVVGPPGSDLATTNATLTDLDTHQSSGTGQTGLIDGGSLVTYATNTAVRGGDTVRLVVTNVTNPPVSEQAASYRVVTSSDESLSALAVRARPRSNKWISTIASSLPTPREAFTPVKSVPADAGIAAIVALFLSFPSTLFNQTFQDNYAAIADWWDRRTRKIRERKWFRAIAGRVKALRMTEEEKTAHPERADLRAFVVVLVAGALLACFNDPTFLSSVRSLVTFPSALVSMIVSISIPAAVTLGYHRRRFHAAPWRWHALPAGLLVAVVCVLFSRATRFEPGYLYGVMVGIAFTRRLGRNPKGHVAFLTTLASIVVAIAAWFAWVPISRAANANPSSLGLGFADDIVAMLFVGGLVGAFFALIPVRGLAGYAIRRWEPRAWLGLYFLVVFTLVQVLLRPATRASASTSHAPLLGTLLVFVVAGIASIAFFEHFLWKNAQTAALAATGDGEPARPERRLTAHLALLARTARGPGRGDPDPDDAPEDEEAVVPAEAAELEADRVPT